MINPVYEYEIKKSDEDESNEPKHLVPKMIFRLNNEKEEDPKESKPVQAKAQVIFIGSPQLSSATVLNFTSNY